VQKIIDDMQALKNVKVNPKQAAQGQAQGKADARVRFAINLIESATGEEESRRPVVRLEPNLQS
jgi:hypothetical protein